MGSEFGKGNVRELQSGPPGLAKLERATSIQSVEEVEVSAAREGVKPVPRIR